MLSGLTGKSLRRLSLQVALVVLYYIGAGLCGVTMDPDRDVLLQTADSIHFSCNANTESNNTFVSALHIYKMQGPVEAFNGTQANLTGLTKTLFASSSLFLLQFMAESFSVGKWKASFNQSSAYSASLYASVSGLEPQDSGMYYCEFHVTGTPAAVMISTPITISVVDRPPDLTVNLTVNAPLLNSNVAGAELIINGTGISNFTLTCSASATPLAPDVQLWISGNNVLPRTTRYTNTTVIGDVVGLQLYRTVVVVSYSVSLNDFKSCTSVRCSGYIPRYKDSAELASSQVVIKMSPEDCPAQGNDKQAIRSSDGSHLDGAGMSTLLVVAVGLISQLLY